MLLWQTSFGSRFAKLCNFVTNFFEISFCRFLTQVCLFALRFTKSWHAIISMGGVWCIQRVTLRCLFGLLPLVKVPYASSHKLFNEGVQTKTQIVEAASFTLLSHMTFAGPSLGCNHRLRSGALCSEGHSFEQEVSKRIVRLWTDIHPCLSVFKAILFCVPFVFRGLAFSSLAPSYWTR